MLFKYPLTPSQYARFQHDNNNAEIRALAERAGVEVTDEKVVGGIETVYFRGRCSGTMALVPTGKGKHECWIRVESKPWWLPWFVLDWGFRKALE